MPDLETHEIDRLLSVPAAAIPGQVTRRRFLSGALAATGSMAVLPGWFGEMAAATTPVGADEGILIVLHLGGGNDSLNTVVPMEDGTYLAQRGRLAITNALPIGSGTGLHPALPKLKARYDAGKVAIVQGVGQATVTDLSHFSSTASWMAGTSGPNRTSGWLGRWLDDVPDAAAGLRGVTMGSSVPLHLAGRRAEVTAMDTAGDLFGSDRSEAWEGSLLDTVSAFGSGSTGRGQWADQLGAVGASSVRLARQINPVFSPRLPDRLLESQMTLVARLINANLGIRVFSASLGSFDTHESQAYKQNLLLARLDASIDAFYRSLSPAWAKRVVIMTFSEFGRRIETNASNGTDHGTASVQFLIGDNVRGGFHGEAPRLDVPDARGNPRVHVDHRSVYATVLDGWLGADANAVLGGAYSTLPLFRAGPGASTFVRPTPTLKSEFRGLRGTATVRGTTPRG